jgi:hypothetical protein
MFKRIFLVLFFIVIFSRASFSAKSDFAFRSKQASRRDLLIENESHKLELIRIIISEKAVTHSELFSDFIAANQIRHIGFKFNFFSEDLLKKNYNESKGFSSYFIDDAIEAFPVK